MGDTGTAKRKREFLPRSCKKGAGSAPPAASAAAADPTRGNNSSKGNNNNSSGLRLQDLADEELQNVVKFLDHPKRLALSATCKALQGAVERFSQTAMNKIMRDHVIDDSFEERLYNYFSLPSDRVIPQRCRLHAAHGVSLCTLDMFPKVEGLKTEMAISHDNSHLALAGNHLYNRGARISSVTLYIWRLSDKTLQQMIELAYEDHLCEDIDALFWMEEKIVVCTLYLIVVVSSTSGKILEQILVSGIYNPVQQDNRTFVFRGRYWNDWALYSVDTSASDELNRIIVNEPGGMFGVCYGRYLLMDRDGYLAVLDLQNQCSEVDRTEEQILWDVVETRMERRQDTLNSFYTYSTSSDSHVNVYEISESGQIFQTRRHTSQPPNGRLTPHERGMVGDFYFRKEYCRQSGEAVVTVQDTSLKRGGLQRLCLPRDYPYFSGRDSILSDSSRSELFISVVSDPDNEPFMPENSHGMEVGVYLANRRF